MTITATTTMTTKKKNGIMSKIKKWTVSLYFAIMTMCMNANVAFADDTPAAASNTAEGKWNAMINFITPWIWKLGGVVALVGGIMVGLGFKSDDSDQMTRGWKTLISGCIVAAVGVSSDIFLS